MNRDRIQGLDQLRVLLMLGGLVVHATQLQTRTSFFSVVEWASTHFRMGAFMAVSGLLTGLALDRAGVRAVMIRRLRRLGLPLATGLVALAPVATVLIAAREGTPLGPTMFLLRLHHLWFLLALILYLPLVALLAGADRRFGLVRRLEAAGGSPLLLRCGVLTATGALGFGLVLLGDAINTTPGIEFPGKDFSKLILGYAPLYLLGVVLGRSPRLTATLAGDLRLPLAGSALVVAGELLVTRVWKPEAVIATQLAEAAGLALTSLLLAMALLRLAFLAGERQVFPARLCDAATTIYLVHFPLLIVINTLFGRVGWNVYLEYGLAVLAAGVLSFGCHDLVVSRSRALRLLFNGVAPAAAPRGSRRGQPLQPVEGLERVAGAERVDVEPRKLLA